MDMNETHDVPVDQQKRLRSDRSSTTQQRNIEGRLRTHNQKEYAGSRWAGVALLLATALLSLMFSLQGKGMTFQIGNVLDRVSGIFFGSSTMTFEK